MIKEFFLNRIDFNKGLKWHFYAKRRRIWGLFFLIELIPFLSGLNACKKASNNIKTVFNSQDSLITNRLLYLIRDNFDFSLFYKALLNTGLGSQLATETNYSIFLPDNDAFIAAGIPQDSNLLKIDPATLKQKIQYHLINGLYPLSNIPFAFNSKLGTLSGDSVFVSKYVQNADTLLTINGNISIENNITASNGYIDIIPHVLNPPKGTVADALVSDSNITSFAYAFQRTNLITYLSTHQNLTVLAVPNGAFSFQTKQAIDQANLDSLTGALQNYIIPMVRFSNDFLLDTGINVQPYLNIYPTLGTQKISVRYGQNFGINANLKGPVFGKNKAFIIEQDQNASNGVLQVLDSMIDFSYKLK